MSKQYWHMNKQIMQTVFKTPQRKKLSLSETKIRTICKQPIGDVHNMFGEYKRIHNLKVPIQVRSPLQRKIVLFSKGVQWLSGS